MVHFGLSLINVHSVSSGNVLISKKHQVHTFKKIVHSDRVYLSPRSLWSGASRGLQGPPGPGVQSSDFMAEKHSHGEKAAHIITGAGT